MKNLCNLTEKENTHNIYLFEPCNTTTQNMILSWIQTVNFVLNRTFHSFAVLAAEGSTK